MPINSITFDLYLANLRFDTILVLAINLGVPWFRRGGLRIGGRVRVDRQAR